MRLMKSGPAPRAGRKPETVRPGRRPQAVLPMTDAAASLFLVLQIFFVDLLLGADNAIVIAMACGRLRPEDARRAIISAPAGRSRSDS